MQKKYNKKKIQSKNMQPKRLKQTRGVRKRTTSKLDTFSETDGKVEKFKPTTIDQLLGDKGLWRYNTLDEDEYTTFLDSLSVVQLKEHAQEHGLLPNDNLGLLKRKLISEFRIFASQYQHPAPTNVSEPLKKVDPRAEKIMQAGR